MNILIDRLPKAIKIQDKVYSINTDFRDCLLIILAFEDNELTWLEKQAIMLENLYCDFPSEEYLEEAITKAVKFLDGGNSSSSENDEPSLRLYSFSKDANLVFAAFQQTHRINLQNIEYMHWWQFLALFMDLGSDSLFCNLIGLRSRVKKGKASKEEIAASEEMGDIFDIPEIDTRTLQEKEQEREFLELVKQADQRKKEQKING